ncbi:MAG TPA: hypothetical protein VIN06_05300 [Devosia sp.]
MTIARTLLAATAALFIGAGAAQAEAIHSPEGKWVTNGGESKYEISLCGKRGDAICAKMIWADDSPLGQRLKANIVKTDILEVPRTGNQRWYGKLEWQGHVVRGTIDLTDANNIHIKGCNGAVCQTVELIRIK